MISSECSSHFYEAYCEYKKGQWLAEHPSNSGNTHLPSASTDWQQRQEDFQQKPIRNSLQPTSTDDVLDQVISKLNKIPLITTTSKERSNNDISDKHETADVFKKVDDETDRVDQPIRTSNVPTFWKKDMRDRRKSINPLLLSQVHLENLGHRHRRLSLNPESFDGLRQLSIKLQDERGSPSRLGFDSELGDNEDDNETKDDVDDKMTKPSNKNKKDTDKLPFSPLSNKLMHRSRRLSVDNIVPFKDNASGLTLKRSVKKLPMITKTNASSLPTVESKQTIQNTKTIKHIKRLDCPSIEEDNKAPPRYGRRASLAIIPLQRQRGRRLSLQPQDLVRLNETSKKNLSVTVPGHTRRASRVISKFEQDLIQKEIALIGKPEEKDPLKELKACRYLRHNYEAEESEHCPCHTCELPMTGSRPKSTNSCKSSGNSR